MIFTGDIMKRDPIQELFNDPMIAKLGESVQNLNIFKVLKLGRYEIRHSNFLSWLMDPLGNHGLGSAFLEQFIKDSLNIDVSLSEQMVLIKTEHPCSVGRIDLLITFGDTVVCIENKIDSPEHSAQLSRYLQHINNSYPSFRKFFVYLTPDGRHSEDPEDRTIFRSYSYERMMNLIRDIYEKNKADMDIRVQVYLTDYLDLLQNEIVQGRDLSSTFDKIIAKHKDVFDQIDKNPDLLKDPVGKKEKDIRRTIDMIIDIKNSRMNMIYDVLEKRIIDQGWVMGSSRKGLVRFLTKELYEMIPRTAFERIPNRESFLFEFNMNHNRITLFTIIPKGNDHNKGILVKALDRVVGEGKARGETITKHVKMDFDVNVTSLNVDEEHIIERVDSFWPQIVEMVDIVEKEILKEKEKFVYP